MRPVSPRFPTTDVARGLTTAAITVCLAAVGVFVAVPASREWLGTEGGFVAWTATAGFLITIVATVTLVVRTHSLPRSYLLVAAIAGVGAIEAGYSGLVFSPPEVLGIEVDGGAALLEIAGLLGLTPLVVAAAVLPLGVGLWMAHRRGTLRSHGLALVEQRPLLLALAAGLAIAAAWVTGAVTSGPAGAFSQEMLMLAASGVTLAAAGRMAQQRRTVVQWRRRIRPWINDDASRVGGPDSQRWHDAA